MKRISLVLMLLCLFGLGIMACAKKEEAPVTEAPATEVSTTTAPAAQ